jgi:hypothetical protein
MICISFSLIGAETPSIQLLVFDNRTPASHIRVQFYRQSLEHSTNEQERAAVVNIFLPS